MEGLERALLTKVKLWLLKVLGSFSSILGFSTQDQTIAFYCTDTTALACQKKRCEAKAIQTTAQDVVKQAAIYEAEAAICEAEAAIAEAEAALAEA